MSAPPARRCPPPPRNGTPTSAASSRSSASPTRSRTAGDRFSVSGQAMTPLRLGLVHTPVMPFGRDHRIDFDLFGRLIDFHQRHGAEALALPMHAAESVSLPEAEKHAAVEFAVRRAKVPIVAHVSEAGSALAAALARHAESAGAGRVSVATSGSRTVVEGGSSRPVAVTVNGDVVEENEETVLVNQTKATA